jgi:cell division protein FtsA
MEGVGDMAEEILHPTQRIVAPQNVKGHADIVKNPIYSTGVGLLLYGLKQHQERAGLGIRKEPQIQLVERVKGWFQGNF